MNSRIALVAVLLLMVAAGLQASPHPASTCKQSFGPAFAVLTGNTGTLAKAAQNGSPEPILIPAAGDPSGDGLNSCSVADCQVCNYNGLMCTPTKDGCNCDYWIFES